MPSAVRDAVELIDAFGGAAEPWPATGNGNGPHDSDNRSHATAYANRQDLAHFNLLLVARRRAVTFRSTDISDLAGRDGL
jgi:hypothetical protein